MVITPLAGALLLRERLSGPCRAGVFLASVGLALLSLRGFAVGVGEALTLACAVAFALHVVALGAWSSRYDAHGLVVVQLLTVTVAAGVVAVPQGVVVPGTRSEWTAVLVTAIAATAVGYFLQTWAQARLSATRPAVILTGEPVFAGLAGVLVVGDRLDGRAVAGGLLVLVAMSLVAQESYEGRHRQGRSVVPRASIPVPRREATLLARPSSAAGAAVPRRVGDRQRAQAAGQVPADDGRGTDCTSGRSGAGCRVGVSAASRRLADEVQGVCSGGGPARDRSWPWGCTAQNWAP